MLLLSGGRTAELASSVVMSACSILVHKNEGMRAPTAARGYEWMVICELAC